MLLTRRMRGKGRFADFAIIARLPDVLGELGVLAAGAASEQLGLALVASDRHLAREWVEAGTRWWRSL